MYAYKVSVRIHSTTHTAVSRALQGIASSFELVRGSVPIVGFDRTFQTEVRDPVRHILKRSEGFRIG